MHSHDHDDSHPQGVYGIDYYEGRQKSRALMYRLRRRTDEVERALKTYASGNIDLILDVGTADGLMLEDLKRRMGERKMVGLDRSLELLHARPANGIARVYADALSLPMKSSAADAIVATAVIEHVPDADALLGEFQRVLRKQGLLVLTTPHPFWEHLASVVGHLKESGHYETFDISQLRPMLEQNGFQIEEMRKFMFSPIGFPAEKLIERIFGPLGLKFIMANQLVVARRT